MQEKVYDVQNLKKIAKDIRKDIMVQGKLHR